VKTLVVCIDGTWNTPGQFDRDPFTGRAGQTKSNVALTWEGLTGERLHPSRAYGSIASLKGQPGMALYLSGIGSSGCALTRYLHGATGRGLEERIRDAYRFLSERWQLGDRIFGFGFSRGAFAIRSLIGFIEAIGLPSTNNLIKENELARLYSLYRKHANRPIQRPNWTVEAPVQFLGLWDTVGAIAFGRLLNAYHVLSPGNIAHVCHAVALDEERRRFRPEHWISAPRKGQIVEEVFFAGAHTNVGGGYYDSRLSRIPLAWVLRKARDNGLSLDLSDVSGRTRGSAFATKRASYLEFWDRWPVLGQIVTRFGVQRTQRTIRQGQRLHSSVLEAMRKTEYRPSVLGLDQLQIT
jgi:uncharacterized protein (DUF2235 family)